MKFEMIQLSGRSSSRSSVSIGAKIEAIRKVAFDKVSRDAAVKAALAVVGETTSRAPAMFTRWYKQVNKAIADLNSEAVTLAIAAGIVKPADDEAERISKGGFAEAVKDAEAVLGESCDTTPAASALDRINDIAEESKKVEARRARHARK